MTEDQLEKEALGWLADVGDCVVEVSHEPLGLGAESFVEGPVIGVEHSGTSPVGGTDGVRTCVGSDAQDLVRVHRAHASGSYVRCFRPSRGPPPAPGDALVAGRGEFLALYAISDFPAECFP